MNNIIVGLPCYNEEGNIARVINDIKEESKNINEVFNGSVKILAVDDGSTDNTAEIVRGMQDVILVQHDGNKGLGVAVNTIFTEFLRIGEAGDYLVIMDSDFTHKAKYIKDLASKKKEDISLDVVICSRYREGSAVKGLTKFREMLSIGSSLYNQIFLPIKGVRDYSCGYRLYDYKIIKSLETKTKADGKEKMVESQGFSCMVEIAYKINRLDGKFGEVPFVLEYGDREGQSKMKVMRTITNSLLLPFKLRFSKGIENTLS